MSEIALDIGEIDPGLRLIGITGGPGEEVLQAGVEIAGDHAVVAGDDAELEELVALVAEVVGLADGGALEFVLADAAVGVGEGEVGRNYYIDFLAINCISCVYGR